MARNSTDAWKDRTVSEYFDGVGAFVERVKQLDETAPDWSRRFSNDSDDWHGGMTLNRTLAIALNGTPDNTERVLSVVNRIDADQYLTDAPRLFRPAIVGPLVSVPAYLAGMPDCMLQQTGAVASTQGPVTICFDRMVSSYVTPQILQSAGAAVCALALTLQRVRPVEVIVCAGMGSDSDSRGAWVPIINLGVSPFDADALAFALAHPSFARHLIFQWRRCVNRHRDNIPWAWDLYNDPPEHERRLRELCGASGDWLYVGGMRMHDQNLHRNPETWVKEQIERLTTAQG